MEEIRKLTKLTKEELLDELVAEAEAAKEYADYGEEEGNLQQIENIIYVLRNCNYKGEDEE